MTPQHPNLLKEDDMTDRLKEIRERYTLRKEYGVSMVNDEDIEYLLSEIERKDEALRNQEQRLVLCIENATKQQIEDDGLEDMLREVRQALNQHGGGDA